MLSALASKQDAYCLLSGAVYLGVLLIWDALLHYDMLSAIWFQHVATACLQMSYSCDSRAAVPCMPEF